MQLSTRTAVLDIPAQLAEMGLSVDVLRAAIEASQMGRSTCTANDPPILAGVTAWGWTVRSLRDQLLPAGWHKSDAGNYSTIAHPSRGFQIVVATGDEGTGLPHGFPRTKFAKGPATRAAVTYNQQHLQIDLFSLMGADEVEPPEEDLPMPIAPTVTWMLLVSAQPSGIRSELSLPAYVGADRRVRAWARRLILPEVAVSGGVFADPAEADLGPEFDPEVRPRGA